MSVSSLERVIRYAYSNGYNCEQWSNSVKQCIQRSEEDLGQDLCDILLKHFFSGSRVYSTLLASYMTYTLTGESPSTMTSTKDVFINKSKLPVNGKLFLSRFTSKDLQFSFNHEYSNHWASMLHLLPSLLSEVDDNYVKNMSWVPILSKLLVILSHIVAIGLYPQQKSIQQRHRYDLDDDMDDSDNGNMIKQPTPEDDLIASQQTLDDDLTASQQLSLFPNSTNQWASDSQMTIDPDSTFDVDATQPDSFIEQQQYDSKKEINTDSLLQGTLDAAGNTLYNSHQGFLQQNSTYAIQHQHPSQSSSLYPTSWTDSASISMPMGSHSLEWDNAISAAKILIDLIEKMEIKGMIEKYAQDQTQQKQVLTLDQEDIWMTCYEILIPGDQKSTKTEPLSEEKSTLSTGAHNNIYIQKLLLLIERLTDRDLERRLAVHMIYRELEDDGTARAMPSAGLMGLIYHMVQIRPTLDDDELVNRLIKLQAIKGSFDESFYLEMWFAGLTGLREASLSTSCTNRTPTDTSGERNLDHGDQCCNITVSTNRLLWKNLVLVKIPHLINRLEEQKEKEKSSNINSKRGQKRKSTQETDINIIESSLAELKTFTGLLNACSPPACCSNFCVPSLKSTSFVNQIAFIGINYDDDDDDDEMMDMNNNMDDEPTTDFHSPLFLKSIRKISTDNIFTSIIRSCQFYKLLHKNKAELLLDMKNTQENTDYKAIKTKHDIDQYDDDDDPFDSTIPSLQRHPSYSSSFRDFDDTMMNADTPDQQSDYDGKLDILTQIEQVKLEISMNKNIEQRIDSIRSNTSQKSISELMHIGLVSIVHWRKIADFLLELVSEKATSRDICGLSRLCGALCDCPPAIDLILQIYPPRDLLGPLEQVCNEWNPTDDYMDVDDGDRGNNDDGGDDDMDELQKWYFKFGKIWTFVLVVANKMDVLHIINRIFKNRNGLCYQFFVTGTIIYGVDVCDEEMDRMIDRWLFAMGGDGISDDLLRTTNIQLLIRITPSIIDRLFNIYYNGKIDLKTLTGALSYYQRRFLQFLIVPGVTRILCNELLTGNSSTVLVCMSQLFLNQSLPDTLFGLCANTIIGSLRMWKECQRQHRKFGGDNISEQQIPTDEDEQQAIAIEKDFVSKLDLDDEQHLPLSESSSVGTTRRTLSGKAREMFRSIVKSGRSMHMNDMGVDDKKLWEPVSTNKSPKQVITHYLDLVMFQAALKMSGMHWFISMIVDEVLDAGKSGGAIRAAELGSGLLTTPLTYYGYGDDTCLLMLWCLLQDVIPFSIRDCASKNTSFLQGQALGVFVSDCLVLMYRKTNDKVDRLGCQFFDALVIDRVRGGDVPSPQTVPQVSDDGSKFAPWDQVVVSSAVWHGFVKGLISNPLIKEMWPDAYTL